MYLVYCRYYCDYCDTHLTHDSVSYISLCHLHVFTLSVAVVVINMCTALCA